MAFSIWTKWCIFSQFSLRPTILVYMEYQVIGDITRVSTLKPEYFKGVRKVINAVSVIVGPKEGDTPERAKYSQVIPQAFQCDNHMVFLLIYFYDWKIACYIFHSWVPLFQVPWYSNILLCRESSSLNQRSEPTANLCLWSQICWLLRVQYRTSSAFTI